MKPKPNKVRPNNINFLGPYLSTKKPAKGATNPPSKRARPKTSPI